MAVGAFFPPPLPSIEDVQDTINVIYECFQDRNIQLSKVTLSKHYLKEFDNWLQTLPKVDKISLLFLFKPIKVLPCLEKLSGLISLEFRYCSCLHQIAKLTTLRVTTISMIGCFNFTNIDVKLPETLRVLKIKGTLRKLHVDHTAHNQVNITTSTLSLK